MTCSTAVICEWMLQWNLYSPAVAGAVKVTVLPDSTLPVSNSPLSAVTVWVLGPSFLTVTVAPAFTAIAPPNEKSLMVMSAELPPPLLSELLELLAGEEHWAAMRDTPEGKLRHEQVMYFDKLVKIRDFRKPTIAAVQGTCSAAGLMLASMCDLIVAADDARFSNPVLRMSGVGVELLVEPWELGPRKAKEFLFCAATFTAEEAERYGLVNRVVPRASLGAAAREMAEQVALVPPLTAEAVKASINHMVDLMGQRESWRYHFMLHQFVSNTPTALAKVEARKAGGIDAVKKEQGRS